MYRDNHFIDQAPSESWKIPFYIVVTLHIGIVLLIIFGPQFSKKTPKFENIYTIDLIELPPQQAAPQPVKQAQPDQIPAKAISVVKPKPLMPAPLAAPISISPIKKKIKKKIKTATNVAKVDKKKAIEERKRLAESLKEEARAQELAEQALRDLEQERQLFAGTDTTTKTPQINTTNKGTGSNRNSKEMNAVEAQWFAAVNSHLLRFWALPEFKQWDPGLLAVIVITVDKNGRILNDFFESKSGDKIFDQFVKKTLQDANPLPKMPAALKKHRYELGLNFKPGTIQ